MSLDPDSCQLLTLVPFTALWNLIMPRIDVHRCWQFQSPYSICVGSFCVEHTSSMLIFGTVVSVESLTPSSYWVLSLNA